MIKTGKFDPEIDTEVNLKKLTNNAYQTNKNFFTRGISEVLVNFLYSREEMNKSLDRETPDWLVGHAPNMSIYIFSPTVFGQVSSHPSDNFLPVLIHEMAHIFIKELYGKHKNQYPWWFNEGIAGYISGQHKKYDYAKMKQVTFEEISSYEDWICRPNYPQALLFTQFLFNQYGKDVILNLLDLASKQTKLLEFPQSFYQATGDIFTTVVDKWFKLVQEFRVT